MTAGLRRLVKKDCGEALNTVVCTRVAKKSQTSSHVQMSLFWDCESRKIQMIIVHPTESTSVLRIARFHTPLVQI